jgi:two-component system, NtrC family, response regulator AtoC
VDPKTHDTTLDADAVVDARTANTTRVTLLFSSAAGSRAVELEQARTLLVGRASSCDVQLEDPSLSRQHARFVRELEGEAEVLRVEDLGSRNGVTLYGERVIARRLATGDTVVLGNVTVILGPYDRVGILGYDRIVAAMEYEVLRARAQRQRFSLLMLRVRAGLKPNSASWITRVDDGLRPIDAVGMYAKDALLIVLPGIDGSEAEAVAIASLKLDASLICGIASFPSAATTSDALITAATEECQRARFAADRFSVARATSTLPREMPGQVNVVWNDAAMQPVLRSIQKLATTPLPVLVLGETGTGKERVAEEVHRLSARSQGPLRVVNCAALPATLLESALFGHERGAFTGADRSHAGVFEQANGGTVFLDEIGELPMAAQAALLRVLEAGRFSRVGSAKEISVDVRIVAATHRNLEAMVEAQAFRLDLMHRLDAATVRLPPLRERTDAIGALAALFLRGVADAWGGSLKSLDAEALGSLQAYAWPGNVRELKNVIERAVAMSETDVIRVQDLPERLKPHPAARVEAELTSHTHGSLRDRHEQEERDLLERTLTELGGDQRLVAEQLGMSLRTLQRRMQDFGMSKKRS